MAAILPPSHPSPAPGERDSWDDLLDRVQRGETTLKDGLRLLDDTPRLYALADELRARVKGDTVTYVVNRNLNFTNMCIGSCHFCAFSRETPYFRTEEEIRQRVREALDYGATEICMQGGLYPGFKVEDYAHLLTVIREEGPRLHLHAFSPEEIVHMCTNSHVGAEEALRELKRAGLGSIPGTAAEIFAPRIRQQICPDKLVAEEWARVIQTAHRLGIPSTSTMMYGHLDGWEDRVDHLLRIREIQRETRGITEFVPLPYLDENNPLADRGCKSPDLETNRRVHALSRVLLHGFIPNIQASWVKMGPGGARETLQVGANDLGGTLMEENISRAAGASFGVVFHPRQFDELIRSAGRIPRQRTTLYHLL
ncbi:MAG: 5-amino-6-(D-ribitylamino)uracil--L-tyrosine 4-hydroxyphenyl transferase CofH [Euryarchaeota archaeon]|nr:5-amino-6-(D-ribitylamino)uracil--L-tyrosine 4-hydroxyphenyl transferase CofH [Euryarchaeota archaeon]